ncbi:hypothetical protein F9L16_23655 [Agarivorans sp. B2Z047]|uniref:hypothetical protein n=1 Tax=Agarivorans sp. B2Z047 TaxID=2652721 RepID=UPI00128C1EB5|nr:hypothetical protein [Agarivorans sp. B2Z047]MPW31954.1 hypothetical protein [Agarivorans sp. B2Z047]UQN41881.1 hypothetical protein LQZ07_19195 [Agarivorans sp. B2Z047]UQN44886.1 hypothetical protein LQZ07_10600 [Agarivorans sp. B2Z047]
MRLPVRIANNLFATRVVAFDITGVRDKGRWMSTQEPDRFIKATIQPAGDKIATLNLDGAESDGALIMHTDAAVYAHDVTNNKEEPNQTYIRHAGDVWKLWKTQNWEIHTGGINRYILTRHRDVDNTR